MALLQNLANTVLECLTKQPSLSSCHITTLASGDHRPPAIMEKPGSLINSLLGSFRFSWAQAKRFVQNNSLTGVQGLALAAVPASPGFVFKPTPCSPTFLR